MNMNDAKIRLALETRPFELLFLLEQMKFANSRDREPGALRCVVQTVSFAMGRVEDAFDELETYLKEAT